MDDESGSKFHVCETDTGVPWKWRVEFASDDVVRMVHIGDWCLETFGKPAERLHYINNNEERWYDVISYGEIYLRADEELTLFTLRWITPDH